MAWQKLGTDTLASPAGLLTNTFTATKFIQLLWHTILSSGNGTDLLTADNNTNTDYAWRYSFDGAADGTIISDTDIQFDAASLLDNFVVCYAINLTGEEKLFIGFTANNGVAGAGTAPSRGEICSKIDTTTNSGQYSEIDVTNGHASPTNYNTDSNLSSLGTN